MQYVGRMEGEGPERVWAHFNEHSGSTSEQGPGLRIDTLNNIACDWNFSKAIEMHETLAARFRDAKKSRRREQIEHEKLTTSLPRKTILDWELEPIKPEDKHKDESWKNWTSPFMDPLIKGGLQETIQEERENEKKAASGGGKRNGAVRWILEGIELEHSAQKLRDEEKALGLQLKPRQANTINSKHIALRDRVDAFLEKRSLYMFNAGDPDSPRIMEFVGEDGEWTNAIDLGLPSSYVYPTLVDAGLSALADLEAKLRRGVCKDALESVKRQLGGKSAAIKHKKTEASGQAAVTHAEAAIQAHTVKIHKTRWRYLNSRDALLQLGATETDLKEYQDLKLEDLKPLKTYYDRYAETVGHGVSSMPWIWKSTVARNVDQWEIQALKTEWFRSRERFKRWDEQLILTKREMVMSIRSFQSHQEIWEWKARNGQATPGMRAYACRRSRFFAALAHQMLDASLEYLMDDVVRFSWAEKWLAANVSGNSLTKPYLRCVGVFSLPPPHHHHHHHHPVSTSAAAKILKAQMQREGLIRNDAALRALCEGLEMEMFGPGGYDGFVASVIRDFKDNGYATGRIGGNNVGSGDVLPKAGLKFPHSQSTEASNLTIRILSSYTQKSRQVLPAKSPTPKRKKNMPMGLVLSSQGASASISPPDSVQPRRNDVSPPEGAKSVAGELAVPSPHEEQHDVVMAEVVDWPTTPVGICSPESQASQAPSISSTVRDNTPSSSLLPPSPSHSSCSDQSECLVDYMIAQI
ncbi:hypothetical protein FS749_000777 [Ceratobasidium sp. UAMH 11750]|nr:hypothetical protein FS749_000777 [Ceratobasidium sp. UAMH 11750]